MDEETTVTLYSGPALLTYDGEEFGVDVEVEYLMSPRPKPVVRARAPSPPPDRMLIEADEVALALRGTEIPVLVTTSEGTYVDDRPVWRATLSLTRQAAIGEGEGMVRLEAGLVNFLPLHGLGQHTVVTDAWTVELEASPDYRRRSAWSDLSLTGAYAETHRVAVERTGGGEISPEEAEDVLRALHYFLSFAAGDRIGLVHPRGLDEEGGTVWEVWGAPQSRQYSGSRLCWVDPHRWQGLGYAMAGFFRLWESELWREPFETALYWHLLSNRQGANVDGGVILTQAALELLAWVYLVQDRGLVSPKGFGTLDAADQLRLTLSACRIPTEVPEGLEQVRAGLRSYTAPAGGPADGPHVFTAVRNAYVHPVGKKPIRGLATTEASFEVWVLGTWYTELLLLSLMGYEGVYANRCRYTRWVGEVEEVPWATSPQEGSRSA